MRRIRRLWIFDGIIGTVVGGIIGAIVGVNFIITVGIGYDVTLGYLLKEHPAVGVLTVGILGAGPVAGVMVMRRLRRRRTPS